MLDTNIVSDLIRNPGGRAAERVRAMGGAALAVKIITPGELRFGAATSGWPRLKSRVDVILGTLDVIAFDVPADGEYAAIRVELLAAGSLSARTIS